MSFWRRPHSVLTRRILFQVHVWTGVTAAAYALFIGLTGALLVFRSELQQRIYPHLLAAPVPGTRLADPATVVASLRAAFPGARFSGFEYPTDRRGAFLAYVARGAEVRKVFADPATGRILGDLPPNDWIQQLQDLHFNFKSGQPGYVVNGIGAASLLVMALSGLVIWWPGIARVRQSFVVHFTRGWKRIIWELHGAAGIWTVLLVLVWSISGIYFSFPVPFRNAVAAMTALSGFSPPASAPPRQPGAEAEPAAIVAEAQVRTPGAQLARFIVPSGPSGTYGVVLARNVHGDWDSSDEVTLYFDRYSGEWLRTDDHGGRTAGDVAMTWLGLLHVGNFGGMFIKMIWFVGGLAMPTLAITGITMWWNRFVKRSLIE